MAAITVEPHKSSIGGLDANVMALIAYIAAAVIGWIPGIRYVAWLAPLVIYLIESGSGFVKFHAMQAFILNVVGQVFAFIMLVIIGGIVRASMNSVTTVYTAIGALGVLGTIVTIVSIIITIFALIAMYSALTYKKYYIPLVGNWADRLSGKFAR